MFFKLAVKNVQRSVKDYMVYFLTLTLAVCIFYMFNSVDAQLVMLELVDRNTSSSAAVVTVVGILSFVIAFVLAFLIIYANGFLMKRRKSELGLYMTLGVSNRSIAAMLAVETLLIGILALAAGLAAGYFASQGMSVLTASIFRVRVTNYKFIFSQTALVKTVLYFAVIFVFVMLLNIVSVAKKSLAHLLGAGKENQKVPVRHRWAAIALTTVGAIIIGFSYWFVFAMGFGSFAAAVLPAIAINFLGTLVLLFGLSGILMSGSAKTPRYFKGLRMFSQRQLASRVNTNVVSMAVICTILFLTLVIVSSTASINQLLNRETEDAAPYDVSFTTYTETRAQNVPVEQALAETGIDGTTLFEESFTFPLYETSIRQGDICSRVSGYSPEVWERVAGQYIDGIAVSDFNELLLMRGAPPLKLAEGTFALDCTLDAARDSLQKYLLNPVPLTIGGTRLSYSGLPLQNWSLWTSMSTEPIVMILPDDVAAALAPPYLDILVANFRGDTDIASQMLAQKEDDIAGYQQSSPSGTAFRMTLARDILMNNRMVDATMTFVGLYIGMVFLIASAAILALQQLSAASDDRPRYILLRKLGTDQKMMNSSLLSQVAVYFLLPLALAGLHSVFGISYMVQGMGAVGLGDIFTGAALIALLICAVYGLYFAFTYAACRRIINAKEDWRTQ